MFQNPRHTMERLLALADVRIDGDRPWDIHVHDQRFYARALAKGTLGVGESYMDGWWDCERLDAFVTRVLRVRLGEGVGLWRQGGSILRAKLCNLQKPSRAFQIGRQHYDLGNELYERMLGRRMIYSCGYWKETADLDEAQEAKLDLVCRKLGLRPNMRLADIGCGWGGYRAVRSGALRCRGSRCHRLHRTGKARQTNLRRTARGDPPTGLPRPERVL